MGRANTIREKLTRALDPIRLEIVDDSAKHAGHAGARPGGESHFRVEVVSKAFEGLARIPRQRLVYGILDEELKGGLHALELATLTPDEDHKR